MSQDSDTKTAVTIVDVSGIDVDRVGTEAFVFIHLKGWQEGYVVFSPDGTIRQWFYEVSRRVWSSFSVAGDPIKKATFIVHYDTFWELYCSGWEAPGDVIVTGKDERSAEAWAEKHVPSSKPIVIAIVYDEDLPEYYNNLETQTNVIASHSLLYELPVSSEAGISLQESADRKDCDEIYNNDPRGFYCRYGRREGEVTRDA